MSSDFVDVGVRTAGVIRGLMERGFDETAESFVEAIISNSTTGIISRRLGELSEEAKRLAEAGQRLTIDNPVMRALLADMDDVLQQNIVLIRQGGAALQERSFASASLVNRQLALPGFDDVALANVGITWNSVDPQVVSELVGFIDNPAWEAQLSKYGDDVIKVVRNQVIQGQLNGWGPVRMANAINERINGATGAAGIPQSMAENLMRTLQMQSFRTAQTVNRVANANILEGHIRIAALDDRTCLACIALHGQTLPLNQRVDDHHRGRCTSIPVVQGRPRTVPPGQQWWDNRSDAQKLKQAGPANFNALQSGRVGLDDYIEPYTDDVFGEMLRESSLKGILGNGAQEFYTRE